MPVRSCLEINAEIRGPSTEEALNKCLKSLIPKRTCEPTDVSGSKAKTVGMGVERRQRGFKRQQIA